MVCSLQDLFARQVAETSAEIDPGVGIDAVTDLFLAALSDPDATVAQKRQRIGAVALTTETVAEPVRRYVIAQRLPAHAWPDRVLRVTAIDIATGELVVFDRDSGTDLVDAVAASCAVPGAWPPVTIGERRYMDGGIGSTINLDVVDDCDMAVVLVPAGVSAPSPFGAGPVDEIAAFGGMALSMFADHEVAGSLWIKCTGSALPRRLGGGRACAGPTRGGWRRRFPRHRMTLSGSPE